MKNINPDCVHTCITKPFEDFKTDMIAALTHIELTDLHHDDADSPSDIYTVCDDECYDGLSLFNEFYDEISAYYDIEVVSICYNTIYDEVILICDKGGKQCLIFYRQDSSEN